MSNSTIPSYEDFLNSEKKYIQVLNKPQFRVEKDVLSYRVIRTWEEYGLLEDTRKKPSAWRKFSYAELVWLRIITILRSYGVELSKILKIKKQLIDTGDNKFEYRIWETAKFGTTQDLIVLPDGTCFYAGDSYTISEVYLSINLRVIVKSIIDKKL